MPGRLTPLVNEEYYHIYNRGSEKREIFLDLWDYKRFQKTFYYYQFMNIKVKFSNFAKSDLQTLNLSPDNKLVEIISYCLMPNHFHFLLRQLQDKGISTFLSKISNSYTKYFNTKNDRVGPLLQGAFKACLINKEEYFIHLSRYIHLNPVKAGIVDKPEFYKWSSYLDYISNTKGLSTPDKVIELFPNKEGYKHFVEDQIDYDTTLVFIQQLALE